MSEQGISSQQQRLFELLAQVDFDRRFYDFFERMHRKKVRFLATKKHYEEAFRAAGVTDFDFEARTTSYRIVEHYDEMSFEPTSRTAASSSYS